MSSSILKTHVRELLLQKGAVFGDFIMTEFSDPILQEHILSVSITDTPPELQVHLPFCTHNILSLSLSLS